MKEYIELNTGDLLTVIAKYFDVPLKDVDVKIKRRLFGYRPARYITSEVKVVIEKDKL